MAFIALPLGALGFAARHSPGELHHCRTDADCAAEAAIDGHPHICVIGKYMCSAATAKCQSDADCDDGKYCNIEKGTCKEPPHGCVVDEECAAEADKDGHPHVCVDGKCKGIKCTLDEHCADKEAATGRKHVCDTDKNKCRVHTGVEFPLGLPKAKAKAS